MVTRAVRSHADGDDQRLCDRRARARHRRFLVCGVGAILALVFGYKARREIDASGGAQKGRGMAVAGIVLGWVWVGLIVVVLIIAFAVPTDS